MPAGKIIEIEGTDGSGKETQANLLAKKLNNLGIDTLVVSFPDYDSPSSIPLNNFLHGKLGDRDNLTPIEISMLYAFDRSYTFRVKQLKEKLNDGTWLIFDRYVGSNLIYNTTDLHGTDLSKTINQIEKLEYRILELPKPDHVFYLYVPRVSSKVMIENRGLEKDINEANDKYMAKVSRHGLDIAKYMHWNIIDCRRLFGSFEIKPKYQISDELFNYLKQIYKL